MNDNLIFTKMHGAGNDYIFIKEDVPLKIEPSVLARILSKHHFSVGSDGIILITNAISTEAEFKMRIFNADGSEAEMCGNGLRCVAKYLFDRNLVSDNAFKIETLAGIIPVTILESKPSKSIVTVSLPEPDFSPKAVPITFSEPFIDMPLSGEFLDLKSVIATAVNVGNPHCVIFLDSDCNDYPVEIVGPMIEKHDLFPKRTNVEFATILTRNTVRVRVWERGSGETLACGSGATAVVAAGIKTGRLDETCKVFLKGGNVSINWNSSKENKIGIQLTGPAEEVFQGYIPWSFISTDDERFY